MSAVTLLEAGSLGPAWDLLDALDYTLHALQRRAEGLQEAKRLLRHGDDPEAVLAVLAALQADHEGISPTGLVERAEELERTPTS